MNRVLFATIWFVALAIGVLVMADYSTRPGPDGSVVSAWPEGSNLTRPAERSLLMVYLHPHCPCSQATVSELIGLVSRARDLVVQVCFYCPEAEPEAWVRGSLYERALSLSSQPPFCDHGGFEAKRFGVLTSGHVFLFDEHGTPLYSGGVTSGRGHEGANPGLSQLQHVLESLARAREEGRSGSGLEGTNCSPVYGCPIENRS